MKSTTILLAGLVFGIAAHGQTLAGRWNGTIVLRELKVPFSMEIEVDGAAVKGTFVNGDERVTSSSGSFNSGVLRLSFDRHGTKLEAKLENGGWSGKYGSAGYGSHAMEAALYCTCGSEGEAGPDISGVWDISGEGKQERPWQLTVRRKGDDTIAHLVREEDRNGAIAGRFDGLAFELHHFDGSRASLLEIEPRPDGTLDLKLQEPGESAKKFRAVRAAVSVGAGRNRFRMLTRLSVSGFKNLVDVDVRFGPFTCIAGVNGVGKSNLLDAIEFLSALVDHPLVDAAMSVRDEGRKTSDVRSLFHHADDKYSQDFHFQAEMIIPPEGNDDLGQLVKAGVSFLRYSLSIGRRDHPNGSSSFGPLEILHEELSHIRLRDANEHLLFGAKKPWRDSVLQGRRTAPLLSTDRGKRVVRIHQDGKAGVPRNVPTENLPRTVLSTANSAESPTIVLARREMQSWRRFQLEPSSLRRPDEFSGPRHLGTDGSHLAATLYRLAESERGRGEESPSVYVRVANRLAELIGDVRDVWVDRDERRELLTVHVRSDGNTPYPARSLSDGTLRFLALSVLERDPEFTGLLCLEEPENGIHPERIAAMLALLKAIAVDPTEAVDGENPLRQVIVNTHSPGVVGHVEDEDLLIAQHKEYNRDGRRFRGLVLKALPGTWRALKGKSEVASRGALLSYLNPFQPRDPDSPLVQRVIDREDMQLLLPGFGSHS